MVHLNGGHEGSDADAIIWGSANFLCLVVNSIELANFVAVTDCLEHRLDRLTVTRHLEVRFFNTYLGMCRREEQVDSLRLVSVVLVISNRFLSLEWDVHADGWATERTVPIFLLSHSVSAVGLD